MLRRSNGCSTLLTEYSVVLLRGGVAVVVVRSATVFTPIYRVFVSSNLQTCVERKF